MMKISKGDSIVLMTKKQADDINHVFLKQRLKIQKLEQDLEIKSNKIDSLDNLVLSQNNWIDSTTVKITKDSVIHASNLEMSNRVKKLKAAVVSFDEVNVNYNVFPMTNYKTITNKKGEISLKPKKQIERSDWYPLIFMVLTVTNFMIILN